MKQVIAIHGGTTFNDESAYLEYLHTKPITLDRLRHSPSWRESLQESLGNSYDVLLPRMPNSTNARYSEWKLWFENITHVITDDCILIGHSMGGVFLAKYLSENEFPRNISSTILIAAPHSDESVEDLGDFKLERVTNKFISQAGVTTLFFGHDDPVIVAGEIDQYRNDLPDAIIHILSAPDHFVRPIFPELIETITSTAKHS